MIHAELRQSLIDYGKDATSTDAFVALWRKQGGALCEQLPPQYLKALDDVLMRIESSRLFSGDSCSFSRESLTDALALWLDKATARLASP
ncbi:hypothetical protein VVD49_01050 [Uliginosibacterium sp. H3]|uniref:Uncharacterized protein n=1 Tax=Uliginosibacterium silvisoli TaxID=3114758 RepID=A0ABU6JZM3_9RHOO|nr:hypothetical protein [Uliginosibacterium sp. H3]